MKKITLVTIAIGLVIAIGFRVHKVSANPSYFVPTAQTATATTSPVFFQAATATTTVAIYDSWYVDTLGDYRAVDSAALLLRLGATTTPSFHIVYEYSRGVEGYNCTTQPTFCEWYADNYESSSTAFPGRDITISNVKTITGAAGTTTKIVNIPIPTRYVRVTAKVTGAPGNVWAQIIPTKELAGK